MSTTVVTFGQLSKVADQHMADAIDAFPQAQPTPASIARFTKVLLRYTGEITTRFGLAPDQPMGPRAELARQCGDLLRQVQAQAVARAEPDTVPTPPDWRVWAAADALGCGLDILVSHFTGAAPRHPTSQTAQVIADPDTADHLLALVTRHSSLLARLIDDGHPDMKEALRQLAARNQHRQPLRPSHPQPIAAVQLHTPPERIAPYPGEARARALRGIAASAARLIESEATDSITTYRYTAQAAAIAHHLADQILISLRAGITATTETELNTTLGQVAQRIRNTRESWRKVCDALTDLTTLHRQTAADAAVDAGDLVVRLGRMVYADPDWQPGAPSKTTPRWTPTQLAPDPKTATSTAFAVLTTLDAFRIVGDRHQTAIAGLAAARGLLVRTPGQNNDRYVTAAPTETQQLLDSYQATSRRGITASTLLGDTILTLNHRHPQPHMASQTALVVRRANSRSHTDEGPIPTPVALATSGFPVPINLSAPHQPGAPASVRSDTPARRQSL